MGRRIYVIVFIIVFMGCGLIAGVFLLVHERRFFNERVINANVAQGQRIAQALERYHSDLKAYPPSLAILVDCGYLEEIPVPQTRDATWYYTIPRNRPGAYELSFGGYGTSREPVGWYQPGFSEWRVRR